jgi:hypothetical protein
VREYVGTGPLAEIIAASESTRRELRKAQRQVEKDREVLERKRLEALAAPLEEVSEAAVVLAHAHLVDAGYHRRKGEYRRARSTRTFGGCESPTGRA